MHLVFSGIHCLLAAAAAAVAPAMALVPVWGASWGCLSLMSLRAEQHQVRDKTKTKQISFYTRNTVVMDS
jgi:hypothetical protein